MRVPYYRDGRVGVRKRGIGMLIRRKPELTYSDITPKELYFSRREILRGMGFAGLALAGGKLLSELTRPSGVIAAGKFSGLVASPFSTTEKQTSFSDTTHYNNFYEFGTDKSDPARNAQRFRTTPWTVSV